MYMQYKVGALYEVADIEFDKIYACYHYDSNDFTVRFLLVPNHSIVLLLEILSDTNALILYKERICEISRLSSLKETKQEWYNE